MGAQASSVARRLSPTEEGVVYESLSDA